MYKGEISNKFAPTVVIDLNLIFKEDKENILSRALSLVGIKRFKLTNKRIPKYLERLFYKDFEIYLVDRNPNYNIDEKLFEDWCYSNHFKIVPLDDMEALIDQEKVVLAVFDRDYPARTVGRSKAYNFISWGDFVNRLM